MFLLSKLHQLCSSRSKYTFHFKTIDLSLKKFGRKNTSHSWSLLGFRGLQKTAQTSLLVNPSLCVAHYSLTHSYHYSQLLYSSESRDVYGAYPTNMGTRQENSIAVHHLYTFTHRGTVEQQVHLSVCFWIRAGKWRTQRKHWENMWNSRKVFSLLDLLPQILNNSDVLNAFILLVGCHNCRRVWSNLHIYEVGCSICK